MPLVADEMAAAPFAAFRAALVPQSPLRAAMTAAYRRPEAECVAALLAPATLDPAAAARAAELARSLVTRLRAKGKAGGVEGLIHEYDLSSQEGVALMCLAEALLRIPDAATRDALIRDKIAAGDWSAHVGHSPSLFVNAATWGLVVTSKLVATTSETSLAAALTRLIGRGGEPVIRKGVDLAMRMMGEQFVTGQTIDEALANSRATEAKGFRYSYDMLGEAATTAHDAARYLASYEEAIHAIGKASQGRGIYEGPGISIKLSALHPRYSRQQRHRVMGELLARAKSLALLAKTYDICLNIDAEEADRLDLSLDMLGALCHDPELAGWNGLGFVIQAYGKRCPYAIDWIIDLARRSSRRLMIRLVKGAYWDAEIKRAQVDGLADFPVFTRKVHTDVSYLACARKLLAAPDAVFPQFATHNAQTLAAITVMAGPNFYRGQYEFQCLHGMGEPLYEEVVGADKLNIPCRIYAPVGSHETLLAYLVRRLLENGANSSFVNRIADENVPVDELTADPVAQVRAMQSPGAPHDRIALPCNLYGAARKNSRGLDLSDEKRLAMLADGLDESARIGWVSASAGAAAGQGELPVRNPADHSDIVGHVRFATPDDAASAVARAANAAPGWNATPVASRAMMLQWAADALEAGMDPLIGLIVREAGKSYANAVAEIREAVDFLRYYASEGERVFAPQADLALGPVACISPWNFPLAIFTGQVAAALVAGNPVLAKPAEETPLIAAAAVRILHEAGIPGDVLQLVPGAGDVGAALVADIRVQGVMFTGSTPVARLIQRQLAGRLTAQGRPVPLVAETGGQNAMIVDSSALAEQVVADVIASAFDSAGQRCSALRILCLQDDVADRTLEMLRGALAELKVGNPTRLETDIGPVISAEARDMIAGHIEAMRGRGHRIEQVALGADTRNGTFVAPTIIEIDAIADVEREIFGPVLHVLRFKRDGLDALVDAINATGYGLTFGLHTRIDETIARVTARIGAGNVYVNRNVIGATVGVQPFGGSGLSGTGPKAGGPLYLGRLITHFHNPFHAIATVTEARRAEFPGFYRWIAGNCTAADRTIFQGTLSSSLAGTSFEMPGPVGEKNIYSLRPRGPIAAMAMSRAGLVRQIGAILATGNTALVGQGARDLLDGLPAEAAQGIVFVADPLAAPDLAGVLFEGDGAGLTAVAQRLAGREGAIVPLQGLTPAQVAEGRRYELVWLVEECAVTTNTAAAGGNASLMAIG